MWAEAKYYAGMAAGVWSYARHPRIADPAGELRRRVEQREESFLRLARKAAYGYPDSSVCRLLRLARCEYSDLEAMVRSRGLEATLRALCDAGVYVTHDEFKGRVPLIRHGVEVPGGEARFRNPLVSGGIESRSSGSRSGGRGTPTPKSTAFQVYRDAHDELWAEEYELRNAAWLQVRPILPSTTGLSGALRAGRMGRPLSQWFTIPASIAEAGHYRAATSFMVAIARLAGIQAPFPVPLPQNDFSPVARHIAEKLRQGQTCAVMAFASPAVRIAGAAIDLGLDLEGTTFFSGGEATTAAKRAVIARSGARMCTIYHISEVGPIGYGCRQMQTGNDIHLLMDSVAVIARRRPAPLQDGAEVDSLAFTTLLPFAPRFLINAEMDDTGVIGSADHSGCTFCRLGMTTVIREIASFGKLTGQGMTLFGADLVGILEQALPARFGGGPGDYQLVERDLGSQTEVELRVRPRVVSDAVPLEPLREYFLQQLKIYYGGRVAARVWNHAEALRVVREDPVTTYTGKILPLALLGQERRRL